MNNRWVQQFYDIAKSKGIECKIERRSRGWIETTVFNGKRYFTKSKTYDRQKREYFLGVDPSKLNENGDFVLVCGGNRDNLSDIFIIPWEQFFTILKQGRPKNTYKPPKEYLQFKSHLRDRNNDWLMKVQGSNNNHNISKWHYSLNKALKFIMCSNS